MTGTLDRIEAELPAVWSHVSVVSVLVDDARALVEVAKAAQDAEDAMERMDSEYAKAALGTPDWFVVALTNLTESLAALARLEDNQ